MKARILEFPKNIQNLLGLVKSTREEITIVVPFYKKQMVIEILRRLPKRVKLRVITRADSDSDIAALRLLFRRGKIKIADNLHAKIVIFDNSSALVSSLNLSEWGNADAGVLLTGKSAKGPINLVSRWWKEAKGPLTERDVNRLQRKIEKSGTSSGPAKRGHFFSLGGHIRVPRSPFTQSLGTQLTHVDNRDILININWSPHDYKKVCSQTEKQSEVQDECCHEPEDCRGWGREYGCASSTLFRDYAYATSRKAIKEGRLAFFAAKNPNLGCEYYLVGFLYMKSDKPTGSDKWGKKRVYWFDGVKEKSLEFPHSGRGVIRLDRKFSNRVLKSLKILWKRKKKGWSDASYMGQCIRTNPRYISRRDSLVIIREYYRRKKDKGAIRILEELGETL